MSLLFLPSKPLQVVSPKLILRTPHFLCSWATTHRDEAGLRLWTLQMHSCLTFTALPCIILHSLNFHWSWILLLRSGSFARSDGAFFPAFTLPMYISIECPPAPGNWSTSSNRRPKSLTRPKRVRSPGSRSLYAKRINGDCDDEPTLTSTNVLSVRRRAGNTSVLYVTSAILHFCKVSLRMKMVNLSRGLA